MRPHYIVYVARRVLPLVTHAVIDVAHIQGRGAPVMDHHGYRGRRIGANDRKVQRIGLLGPQRLHVKERVAKDIFIQGEALGLEHVGQTGSQALAALRVHIILKDRVLIGEEVVVDIRLEKEGHRRGRNLLGLVVIVHRLPLLTNDPKVLDEEVEGLCAIAIVGLALQNPGLGLNRVAERKVLLRNHVVAVPHLFVPSPQGDAPLVHGEGQVVEAEALVGLRQVKVGALATRVLYKFLFQEGSIARVLIGLTSAVVSVVDPECRGWNHTLHGPVPVLVRCALTGPHDVDAQKARVNVVEGAGLLREAIALEAKEGLFVKGGLRDQFHIGVKGQRIGAGGIPAEFVAKLLGVVKGLGAIDAEMSPGVIIRLTGNALRSL